MLSKSNILLYFCVTFILGVAIRSFFVFKILWGNIFLSAIIIFLIIFWNKKNYRLIIFGGIFLFLGLTRYQLSEPIFNPSVISYYNGQKVEFRGIVSNEPDTRIDKIKLTVSASELYLPKENKSVNGRVLVTTTLYPQYGYGDELKITCKLLEPEPFENFSYDRYLARYDIYSLCYNPSIELLKSHQGNYLLSKIFLFKNKIISTINQSVPEPEASLFSAIILGSRRGIPQEYLDQFNITGTTHLIAISGLNISLIINILLAIAPYFYVPRKKAFYLITLFLVIYIIIIGFPASAVRAAIMGWLILLASKVGRLSRATNILVLAAAILILINPRVLRDDIGFQLSFLAMIGLIYLVPTLERKLEKWPSILGSKEILIMTLAAQATTLPLIIYNFGRLSLIAPVANILVLPLVPALTIAGFIAIILSTVLAKISWLLFWPAWFILAYIVRVISVLADLPYAAFDLPNFSGYIITVAYGFLAYLIIKINKNALA